MKQEININNQKSNKTEVTRIGFDLDGVIFDQDKFELKKGIKHFKKEYVKRYKKKNGKKISLKKVIVVDDVTGKEYKTGKDVNLLKPHIFINSNGYGIKGKFNCNEKAQEKFWYKYMLPYALFMPFRFDSKRLLRSLHNEGIKLYYPTARAKSNENNIIGKIQRGIVKLRFKLAGIPYDKFIFCSYKNGQEIKNKVDACLKNDLDIMVEDKKGNAEAIEAQTKTKTFLYATKNNADRENKDIPRFIDFGELYNGIKTYINGDFKLIQGQEKESLSDEEKTEYYKKYREHHLNNFHDKEILEKRAKRVKRAIKLLKPTYDYVHDLQVLNKENIPTEDGIIYTVNHRSLMDISTVMSAVGPKSYFAMLKAEFLDSPIGSMMKGMNCFFVDRLDKSSRSQANEKGANIILNGANLIICPEGTRNKTKEDLLPFGHGAVAVARLTNRPIVSCGIHRSGSRTWIAIGKKFYVNENDDLASSKEKHEAQTRELIQQCRDAELNQYEGLSYAKR